MNDDSDVYETLLDAAEIGMDWEEDQTIEWKYISIAPEAVWYTPVRTPVPPGIKADIAIDVPRFHVVAYAHYYLGFWCFYYPAIHNPRSRSMWVDQKYVRVL